MEITDCIATDLAPLTFQEKTSEAPPGFPAWRQLSLSPWRRLAVVGRSCSVLQTGRQTVASVSIQDSIQVLSSYSDVSVLCNIINI